MILSNAPRWMSLAECVVDAEDQSERWTSTSAADPVFGSGCKWYFFDETATEVCGPYPTRDLATLALAVYAKTL